MEGIIMDTKILDELEVACSQKLSLIGEDLGALEAAVKAKMRQLGQGLLQRLVRRKSNGYQGSSLACECGGSKRFVGHRSRQVHSIFGWIEIHRASYKRDMHPACYTKIGFYMISINVSLTYKTIGLGPQGSYCTHTE
jgi:hypothetical protein